MTGPNLDPLDWKLTQHYDYRNADQQRTWKQAGRKRTRALRSIDDLLNGPGPRGGTGKRARSVNVAPNIFQRGEKFLYRFVFQGRTYERTEDSYTSIEAAQQGMYKRMFQLGIDRPQGDDNA